MSTPYAACTRPTAPCRVRQSRHAKPWGCWRSASGVGRQGWPQAPVGSSRMLNREAAAGFGDSSAGQRRYNRHSQPAVGLPLDHSTEPIFVPLWKPGYTKGGYNDAFSRVREPHKCLSVRRAPVKTRTSNLLIRSQMLYPIELRVLSPWAGYPAGGSLLSAFAGGVKCKREACRSSTETLLARPQALQPTSVPTQKDVHR